MLEVFGPEGLIAKAHPEYEYRPGQIEMARAVMRAFEEKRHLIVEAGTGTGKTLAYLVPAVAAALGGNGRVIVSTGTKNLQEQLMEKDIPFLQNILPKPFSATYMKGRSNYLCLNRLNRAQSSPVLEGPRLRVRRRGRGLRLLRRRRLHGEGGDAALTPAVSPARLPPGSLGSARR
jgi:ATP-dependent DNA helicase DinG